MVNAFRGLARHPRVAAAADGVAIVVIGILCSLAAPIIQQHGFLSWAFLSSDTFVVLAVSGSIYTFVKVGTVREIESAFDFDQYVEERIAPAYADKLADAIECGDSDTILDLSAAVRKVRNTRKR